MEILINPVLPWPILAVVAVLLLLFSHWTYRPGVRGRRTLLTLRFLAIVLVFFALLRPSLQFSKQIEQSSILAVLVDKSESMNLRDEINGQSRWEAVASLLRAEEGDRLRKLGEKVQVRYFEFANDLTEDLQLGVTPAGGQTAIGKALDEVLRKTAGQRLAGIIVLSDGVNTAGVSPSTVARQLGSLQVPVHAFALGKQTTTSEIRDIAARSINAPETVFAKNRMPIRGVFTVSGFQQFNEPIPVKLLVDGKEVARELLRLPPGADRGTVELSAVPERAGDVKVTLVADVLGNELLPNNNEVSTYVTVLDGGLSALYVDGKYRFWEPKYLRWAIDRSPDIELSQVMLLGRGDNKEGLPDNVFEPGRFDVIILGDLPANRIPQDDMKKLRDFVVDRGGGLMMIGGYEAFGPGGWNNTAVGDVLPVEVRPTDAQRSEPLQLRPTEQGDRHFVLRLDPIPANSRRKWEALRALDGGSQLGRPKANSLVLAAAQDGAPLLVAADVGKGRTAAFAGDTTWRWRNTDDGIDIHARFWRQIILWLAHKEEVGDARIFVRLPQRRIGLGQRLPIEVRIETAEGTPVTDATVQAVVAGPGNVESPVELVRRGEQWTGTFWQTNQPGDYTLKVAAVHDGKDLGARSVKFLVYDENTEMLQLAADFDTLKRLADETDGAFGEAGSDLGRFLAGLKEEDLNLEVTTTASESLWDRLPFFVIFMLLISAEWLLRKMFGLA